MAATAPTQVLTVNKLRLPLWRLGETDSTNAVAWRLLTEGQTPPLAVQAESQSAGRGQWGRVWRSEPGGLYLSLLWAPQGDLLPQAPWVLASAWGLAESLHQVGAPAGLKWPNDLLLEGRKLGGIKLEAKGNALVVGAGLNWANPVPPTGAQLQPFCRSAGLSRLQTLEDLLSAALAG
ncbi:MAG: biotin--[acetyl-CoA-carboxylase] ligase, partial [Cyanobacteriota bacterium]|nr:biotin--[acetyl-CoA-carboxylase] ligase [Cyanobacteriota bacterium]